MTQETQTEFFEAEEVVKISKLPAVQKEQAVAQASALEALIERAVFEGASMEAVERLLALKERVDQASAKKAFDGAIAAAKSEIGPITKNRVVDFTAKGTGSRTNYKFEDLAEIARSVDPALSQYGLSYRYRTTQNGNQVRVTCVVSHRDGFFEETSLEAPVDNSGNKSGIQGIGSTITFLQRYTLKAALGLAVANDDDGRAGSAPASPAELTATQAKRLNDLIDQTGTDKEKFLSVAKAGSVEDIRPADFARLEGLLKRKLNETATKNNG